MTEADIQDLEYQFRVIYTLDNATKGTAHFQFFQPGSAEGKEIHNVLTKYKIADDAYPYKPGKVTQLVKEKTGKKFTSNNHTQAWRYLKARPKSGAAQPGNTNKDYCIYHVAHKDYTYSEKWVDRLVAAMADDAEFAKIKAVKL